jgi:RNA polymerase sigma factor FliA
MEEEERQLWQSYKSNGDEQARDALIELYLPLVRRIAERTRFSLASRVDVEDLFSSGLLGLMDAMDRYTPSRQIKFSTFGSQRIRGAMIDDVRANDWVPRTARDAYSTFRGAWNKLRQELQKEPNMEEMKEELGLDEAGYEKLCNEINVTQLTSIQAMKGVGGQENESDYDFPDLRECKNRWSKELAECLKKAVSELPEKKQTALLLYYHEELTLKEISKVLGVSEGRVSQILSEVMTFLKTRFHDDLLPFMVV